MTAVQRPSERLRAAAVVVTRWAQDGTAADPVFAGLAALLGVEADRAADLEAAGYVDLTQPQLVEVFGDELWDLVAAIEAVAG